MRRVVGVALRVAAVEGLGPLRVERESLGEAPGEVRVGDERPAEGGGVDEPGVDEPLGLGEVVAAGADDRAGVGGAQRATVVVVERRATRPVRLREVQEGEVAAAELAGDVQPRVGALGVLGVRLRRAP